MSTWFTRCATALVVAALASASALADPIPPGGQGDRLKVVSDPINPKEIARWGSGTAGAHRNSYPGGKYAYLSTSLTLFSLPRSHGGTKKSTRLARVG